MAEQATLARPYAKAVFELAREQKKLGEWSALLKGLADAVRDPRVAAAIGHPAVGRGQLAGILVEALGNASTEARNLLQLLSEYGRLKLAPAIAEQYEALKDEAERTVEVEVVSAVPVPEAQQDALLAALRARLDRQVHAQWKTDASLIGGARIRAGDLVIDGTIAGELERLRTALAS